MDTSNFFTFSTQFDIAIDCDDVMVNISSKWMYMLLNDSKFVSLLNNDHYLYLLNNHPFNRKEYDLVSHAPFMLDASLRDELNKRAMELFFNSTDFYDSLYTTSYFNFVKKMIDTNKVSQISIVTQCYDLSLPVNKSKINFIQRSLNDIPSGKYNIGLLTKNEKKSDFIKSEVPTYTTFVDDHLSNIVDVVSNTHSHNKEFLLPLSGFNYDSDIIENLTSQYGCNIQHYTIEMQFNGEKMYEPSNMYRVLKNNDILSW